MYHTIFSSNSFSNLTKQSENETDTAKSSENLEKLSKIFI